MGSCSLDLSKQINKFLFDFKISNANVIITTFRNTKLNFCETGNIKCQIRNTRPQKYKIESVSVFSRLYILKM